MSLYRRKKMAADRDSQSATSSVSLPSVVVKPPKQRRFSLRGIFGRKTSGNIKPRPRDIIAEGVLASIESLHTEIIARESSSPAESSTGMVVPVTVTPSTKDGAECLAADLLECPLCLARLEADCFPELVSCQHRSCLDCLKQYLRIEISESRVNICCPECSERLHPHDIKSILQDPALMEKYEEFMLRRFLVADPDCRWCPAPDCGFAVIASGCASCPKLTCGREGCSTEFCYHCKQVWHPNQTCDTARQQRSQTLRLRSIQSSISYNQENGHADDIKPCPRCVAYIMKMNDGSCNHMTCSVCGCEFCWLCMNEISDLHYLSPSGCTFWGKKPWSRKKKILWQLGTLVGAPVGIALIAGVAVPAMVIGIPVYVGRKIHRRLEAKNVTKHKRNLAITGGVTLSILLSPVIAAVSVGIGVPIMLAYVYGVVPVSLCRNGGCGVSAGNGRGVRIEFDDDNDVNMGGAHANNDSGSVADARHSVTNPSIGESSVGGLTGSLSASGSHIERAGVLRDTVSETASTTALAGASITGSCYSRLEVQADVQKERSSLSGESVSLAISSDNTSSRAVPTSMSSGPTTSRDGTNMEVHVDIETRPAKRQHGSGSCGSDEPPRTSPLAQGVSPQSPVATAPICPGKYVGKRAKDCGTSKKGKFAGKRRTSIKIKQELREASDTQVLDRGSVNSSELESPSLSDSLPSVAGSHSSHLSEFGYFEGICEGQHSVLRLARVSPLPEVENDRPSRCDSPPPPGPTTVTSSRPSPVFARRGSVPGVGNRQSYNGCDEMGKPEATALAHRTVIHTDI
uniref:RBR-type E3 ubiquitin transferase n=1 Tax=Eptatretus burgeri TaxID=7764 RepID=A0A8C4X1J4_EPTBU